MAKQFPPRNAARVEIVKKSIVNQGMRRQDKITLATADGDRQGQRRRLPDRAIDRDRHVRAGVMRVKSAQEGQAVDQDAAHEAYAARFQAAAAVQAYPDP